ncbi:DUF262 domain-containing protein [Agromyces tardus]|uniref:DUF262 domain-containing protein n=1 Tax=Agromyces tardus TaxID=2583849 RepID=UPI00148509FF|nr:DUF262 domain-containing protein [Agromyces tardus]
MESKTTDFLGLIKGPRQYRVPPFQRAYSWEKEQRETLWLDILDQYDRLSGIWSDPEREKKLQSVPGHYLGTVVLAGPSALGVPRSDVIDGQQRITTLLLLLCALRDVRSRSELNARGTKEEREARASSARARVDRRYLVNEDEIGSDRLRLVPLAADRRVFEAIIDYDGARSFSPESIGLSEIDSKRMLQAYKFFHTELRRQGVNAEQAPQLVRFAGCFPLDLEIIEEVITRRLTLITIETANLDDVNSIFESLNAKGRPLTQLDLLRNYLFMLLGSKAEAALGEHWSLIERNLHRPEQVEGLIWAEVVSRGTNILQKRTYRTVQAELRLEGGTPEATEAYLKSLARKSALYAAIVHPERESNAGLGRAFARLTKAGGVTAYPLAMWLLEQRHLGHLNTYQVVEAIGWIESLLVRRLLAGLPTNTLSSIFGSMLSRLHGDLSGVEDRLHRLQMSMIHNQRDWPTDAVVAAGIEQEDFYHSQKAAQRMLILSTMDHALAPSTVLNYGETDDSIEHILPQSREAIEWISDLADIGEDFQEVQSRWLHTLPNLTIVTPSENSALGARRFASKAELYEESPYKITRDVATRYQLQTGGNDHWGASAIQARARDLTALVTSIWVRPEYDLAEPPTPGANDQEFDVDPGEELVPFTTIADELDPSEG